MGLTTLCIDGRGLGEVEPPPAPASLCPKLPENDFVGGKRYPLAQTKKLTFRIFVERAQVHVYECTIIN